MAHLLYSRYDERGLLVWPTRKDSEPRPRNARAGSAPTKLSSLGSLPLPLFFSASPIGKPKGPDKRGLLVWPTRKDSNLRPSESESDALSSCATGRYSFHTLLLYHKPFKIATPFPKKVIVKFRVFPPGLAKWPKSLFLSAYMKHIFTIFR